MTIAEESTITKPSQIGALVRARRKETGLNQSKLAALAGVGTRFLSELERGKPTAQLGKTLQILEVLGLELRITRRK